MIPEFVAKRRFCCVFWVNGIGVASNVSKNRIGGFSILHRGESRFNDLVKSSGFYSMFVI